MDDEDLEEMRASQKLVDTSEPGSLPGRPTADTNEYVHRAIAVGNSL